tara:strand:- start:218 stop:547 length:330 start_codon:yes stop_codon:yes gene_type:complete
MLLPDIKFDVNTKYLVFLVLGLCAIGTIFALGYLTALEPKEVVCKDYIEQLDVATGQVHLLEQDISKTKDEYLTKCIDREKQICTELIQHTKENIAKLRCKICKAGGVY